MPGWGSAWKAPGTSWSARRMPRPVAGTGSNTRCPSPGRSRVPPLLINQRVLAVAEVGEVVGVQPGQQLPGQGRLLGPAGDAHRVLEQLDGLLGAGDHLLPVLDGLLDQPEHLEQAVLQVGDQRVGAVRPRGRQDLQVHPGLGRHGGVVRGLAGADDPAQLAVQVATDQELRVEHLADAPTLAKQLHGHRVDEERPVVGDDLHHGGPAGRPAVVALARRTDRDHRTGCGPVQGGPVVAGHQAQQILDPALVDVDRVDVAEVVAQEDLLRPPVPGRTRGPDRLRARRRRRSSRPSPAPARPRTWSRHTSSILPAALRCAAHLRP